MIKQAPRPLQIVVMGAFVLSCFAVLLYLWLSFGGTSPLQPKGYRFHVQFPEATQLVEQVDVRISGVPVGKVVAVELGRRNRTDATIEMEARHAPVPRDARAILRAKSLLGETYVELTPGNPERGMLPEGGTLPRSAVHPTVQLDEIFQTFDAETRRAWATWMQSQAGAVRGRGADINAALAVLPELVSESEGLLANLNAQSEAFSRLVSSTGDFFDAISERRGQLAELITQSNRLWRVTARRNRELAQIWRELPRFERESRLTLPRLTRFTTRATPVVRQLQPVASQMTPAFRALERLAPEYRGFFARLGPLVDASKRGVPSLERLLEDLPPLLDDFHPWLRNVNPILSYLGLHRRDLTGFLANLVASTNARDLVLERTNDPVHYLRAATPLGPEALSFLPRPLRNSRANSYSVPGVLDQLATGLPVYDTRPCSNGMPPPPDSASPPELKELVELYVYRTEGRDVAAPPCEWQGLHPGFGTSYPRLRAEEE